ncbi:MAG: class I SAM-dependent methyltransferase [Sphaerochaetaceae bacterium]|nr:class I SAM-dependent methyltransferase [Sphaerochaetaceae bacterium]
MYNTVFDSIASVYGWFYGYQKKGFKGIIDILKHTGSLREGDRVLDLGCGTGALCAVLAEHGHPVTGIDASARMIDVARNKTAQHDITYLVADATAPLAFPDDSFDLVIASHVVHGLAPQERHQLYEQMKRVAVRTVVIHDYNTTRSLITDILEYLERGDYFNFIQIVEQELREQFPSIRIEKASRNAHLYICTCQDAMI